VKQVGEVLAELLFGEDRGHDEIRLAALAVGPKQVRRPVAGRALDDHELAENVEAVLTHGSPP
jgi:hypothetical protein